MHIHLKIKIPSILAHVLCSHVVQFDKGLELYMFSREERVTDKDTMN